MAASPIIEPNAQMAKLVDAPASGAGDRKVVEVRVLFWAPSFKTEFCMLSIAPFSWATINCSCPKPQMGAAEVLFHRAPAL
jgi:hypothetical protein